MLPAKRLSRHLGRIRFRDPILGLQRTTQPVSRRGFVIHDQNGFHHSVFLTSFFPYFLTSLLPYFLASLLPCFLASLLLCLFHRQRHVEPRAAPIPRGALPIHVAAKLGHASSHNRQPQSCSLRLCREKRLEHLFSQRRRDSRPILFHPETTSSIIRNSRDHDMPPARRGGHVMVSAVSNDGA